MTSRGHGRSRCRSNLWSRSRPGSWPLRVAGRNVLADAVEGTLLFQSDAVLAPALRIIDIGDAPDLPSAAVRCELFGCLVERPQKANESIINRREAEAGEQHTTGNRGTVVSKLVAFLFSSGSKLTMSGLVRPLCPHVRSRLGSSQFEGFVQVSALGE